MLEKRLQEKQIYTVSALTQNIRKILEQSFPEVWIEGEISNFVLHSSGHMYFSLKDEKAVLQAALFRGVNQSLKFKLENGMKVVVLGNISVYERRGQYQLIVKNIEPKGIGALQLAFEQLKKKLEKEGLFDEAHKRPIPYLPTRIGVVTSPTGAAIRDILNIAKRRFQNIEVIINPVRVQGKGSEREIARAIEDFNEFNKGTDRKIDVLIVGRGGGSIEDLWAFNEELTARAIYNSNIPVISAVGHQIDFTISDFVADKRAPTPSAATELVIPRKEELQDKLSAFMSSLKNLLYARLGELKKELAGLANRYVLRQPENLTRQLKQRLDDLQSELQFKIGRLIELKIESFKRNSAQLEALSPLAVLARGYSVTYLKSGKKILRDAKVLKRGNRVLTQLGKGSFESEVKSVERKDD